MRIPGKHIEAADNTLQDRHKLNNLILILHDSHLRILWVSNDPLNEAGLVGQSPYEICPENEHHKLDVVMKLCFIWGESAGFVMEGPDFPPRGGRSALWRVTMIPVDTARMLGGHCVAPAIPGLAAISFNSKVPRTFESIAESDKELLQLLYDDFTLKEAARKMLLSESAIDAKVKKLKAKLGVRNIGGLVAESIKRAVI